LPPLAVAAPAAAAAPVLPAPAVLARAAAPPPAQHAAAAEAPAMPHSFATAFLAPAAAPSPVAAVAQDANHFTQDRVVKAQRAVRPAVLVPAAAATGTQLVQLGSFASEQVARRAWTLYTGKYPQLANHKMVISEAVVRGKHYWRVAAAGYSKADSASMCGLVKSGGAQCFAYDAGRPLPGAIDTGVRLASR
ncbi:MAG: SPOR domain-containing protein, partial [Croceibacterium sp.]